MIYGQKCLPAPREEYSAEYESGTCRLVEIWKDGSLRVWINGVLVRQETYETAPLVDLQPYPVYPWNE
jgi:hypothetical protein